MCIFRKTYLTFVKISSARGNQFVSNCLSEPCFAFMCRFNLFLLVVFIHFLILYLIGGSFCFDSEMLTCPFLLLLPIVNLFFLFWQVKEMDDNLPFDMEEILRKEVNKAAAVKLVEETSAVESDSLNNSQMYPMVASTEQETIEVGSF